MAKTKRTQEAAPVGITHSIRLNLPEFAPLFASLETPAPSALSPLPDLCAHTGPARDLADVTAGVAAVTDGAVAWALTPLAIPDRIVDVRAAVFEGAPTACRMFSSRREAGIFTGLRPHLEFDYELLFPFSPADLEAWVQLQLQFSAGQEFPLPQDALTGEQLASLLALIDAYKTCFIRSFAARRDEPQPVVVTARDVLEAQTAAAAARDRRWILPAVNELLALMDHPGGAREVRLPSLTEKAIDAELSRYASEGLCEPSGGGYVLGMTLGALAGDLFTWLGIATIHDLQVIGGTAERPEATEELLLYVTTAATNWTLVSEGLARAGQDLSGVTFRLRSCDLVQACDVARAFLEPQPDVALPDSLYAPAAASAPAASAGAPAAEAAPPPPATPTPTPPPQAPPPAAPAWAPTHLVPASGMAAWAEPDPSAAPVANLDPRLDVQLLETRGAWAHVLCSNGWSAWVDGRLLESMK